MFGNAEVANRILSFTNFIYGIMYEYIKTVLADRGSRSVIIRAREGSGNYLSDGLWWFFHASLHFRTAV